MEFRGEPRGTLLRRLHVEDARLFHDHDPGSHNCQPAQQYGRTAAVGCTDRSLQQQGGAWNYSAALPRLYAGLDFHGSSLVAAVCALCLGCRSRFDGGFHGRGRACLWQCRHEAIPSRSGYGLSRSQ